jgi:hypothetical protein
VPRRRVQPQAIVVSPLLRQACPGSGLPSTAHAPGTCSPTFRTRAARARVHRLVPPHQSAPPLSAPLQPLQVRAIYSGALVMFLWCSQAQASLEQTLGGRIWPAPARHRRGDRTPVSIRRHTAARTFFFLLSRPIRGQWVGLDPWPLDPDRQIVIQRM